MPLTTRRWRAGWLRPSCMQRQRGCPTRSGSCRGSRWSPGRSLGPRKQSALSGVRHEMWVTDLKKSKQCGDRCSIEPGVHGYTKLDRTARLQRRQRCNTHPTRCALYAAVITGKVEAACLQALTVRCRQCLHAGLAGVGRDKRNAVQHVQRLLQGSEHDMTIVEALQYLVYA